MEERLLREYTDLVERITLLDKALTNYNNNPKESMIPEEQIELMTKQIQCMFNYRDILTDRIILIMKKR